MSLLKLDLEGRRSEATARRLQALFWLLLLVVTWLALSPKPPQTMSTGWDKGNHLLAFSVLGLLAFAAWARLAAWRIWLGLLAYGLGLELAQGMTPTRSAEAWDLMADALGIAVAHALVMLFGLARQRWQQLR